MPFTVAAGARAFIDYDVTIDEMVLNNSKVVIVLSKEGDATPIFSQTFNQDAQSALAAIGPGSYSLFVSAGAEATNKGIPDEREYASFNVVVQGEASNRDAVVPLPAAVVPGGVMLLALAGGMSLRRRAGAAGR
jgi:hypothetical protein